jgi:hypothetical protein
MGRMAGLDSELPRHRHSGDCFSRELSEDRETLPGYGFWKRLQTVHFAPPKHKFYAETEESRSPMHKSVYRRFEAASVLLHDRMAAYRPDNMRVHVDFKHYFDGSPVQLPQCVADDIEKKWEDAGHVGRL